MVKIITQREGSSYFGSGSPLIDSPIEAERISLGELSKAFRPGSLVAFDLETTGLDPHEDKILTAQFSDGRKHIVLDLTTEEGAVDVLRDIAQKTTLIGHNLAFDLKFLKKLGIEAGGVFDTMVIESLLNGARLVGLGELIENRLGVTISKGKRVWSEWSSAFIRYAVNDVAYLHQVREAQLADLKRYHMTELGEEENRNVLVTAELELNGVKFEKVAIEKLSEVIEEELPKIDKQLDRELRRPQFAGVVDVRTSLFAEYEPEVVFNWRSSKQRLELFKRLDPTIEKTDKEAVAKRKHLDPIFGLYADRNEIENFRSKFTGKLIESIHETTGRVHARIRQNVSTGRQSWSDPPVQQVQKSGRLGEGLRKSVIAEKGFLLVGGDYSGCELRIMAVMANITKWLERWEEDPDFDLHTFNACEVFGIAEVEVRMVSGRFGLASYRDVVKTLTFGMVYGMSAHKLSATIGVTLDEAQAIIDDFFAANPELEEFVTYCAEFAQRRGFITSKPPYNRRRFFHDGSQEALNKLTNKQLGRIGRQAQNHPVQATNADLLKRAMSLILLEGIRKVSYPVKLVLSIHDEIITECPEQYAEEWAVIMGDLMTKAGQIVTPGVRQVAEVKVGRSWYDLK